MTTYVKYQCTVCRREKTLEQETLRVTPNACTITKACSGILQVLGLTATPINQIPVAGLEDWYPSGSRITVPTTASTPEAVSIGTSDVGAIVIAFKEQDEGSLPSTIDATFEQRRSENVSYSEYTYRPQSASTVFTGKDTSGKILRIDSAAIAEERIQVRVNGVLTVDFTATSNTVTLATAAPTGSVVNIRVQSQKETVTRTVTFTRNLQQLPTIARGSWASVDLIRRFTNGVGLETWWIYSVDSGASLGTGKLKLVSLDTSREAMVLLAHTPFTTFDRYLNFIVPVENLMGDFPINLDSTTRVLSVDRTLVQEIYPPIQLSADGFVSPEARVTTSSSALVIDDVNVLLQGSKILGQV
jgi:hypothetical protein